MERVVRGRAFTLSQSFYSDGALVTPSSTPSVAIVRSDGSTLATSAVAGTGTGPYTTTVAAAANTILDTLTVTWTATISAQANTYVDTVEVAGGFLFTLAEARAVPGLENTSNYTTADIVEMRMTVEDEIEKACSRAFVPRYALHAVDGSGDWDVRLRRKVRSIRSVTRDGVAVSNLSAIVPTPIGAYNPTGWWWGVGNYVIGYEHGYTDTPAGVKRAALLLLKTRLVGRRSPVDDRALTFSATDGGSYSLSVPGRNGSLFGIPDVDAALDRYRTRVSVA